MWVGQGVMESVSAVAVHHVLSFGSLMKGDKIIDLIFVKISSIVTMGSSKLDA